jgi:hypothetical protein
MLLLIRRSSRVARPGIILACLWTFQVLVMADTPKVYTPQVQWNHQTLREVYNPPGRLYCYSPSVVVVGHEENIFSCQNVQDGVIRDHIVHTIRRGGKVVSNEPVLAPGAPGAWDSFHVCDPSVIEGSFRLEGNDYRLAMFYLGNDVDASRRNQVGVAFANHFAGPWVRYAQPVVRYPGKVADLWGAGQPSAVSLDGKGRVLLFYTVGVETGTFIERREMDLSDMAAPQIGPAVRLTTRGLTDREGRPDFFNQADFVYHPPSDRYFAIRAQRPHAGEYPTYVDPSVQLISIEAVHVRDGGGAWRIEGVIDPQLTGFPRNHNAGLARTSRGELHGEDRFVRVVFTVSESARTRPESIVGHPDALWTYALWEITGRLPATQD